MRPLPRKLKGILNAGHFCPFRGVDRWPTKAALMAT